MGYVMLHLLAGATIQVANLVIKNCHHIEDGNKWAMTRRKILSGKSLLSFSVKAVVV